MVFRLDLGVGQGLPEGVLRAVDIGVHDEVGFGGVKHRILPFKMGFEVQ